ncbi:EamA family transporter [Azospirillum isscasi]|uniref:EamA family transporter n=1 Tax=Azospirillum isscasi TaxID=3053926 RepID=A0ABU0WIH5_9PROT|nr:EamA family transporter [Azospirillum isscasi]MDQ2103384.1 EamA family transporter [Azospirillum isscasi]
MTESGLSAWVVWALLSAAFAALTAILAKVGVEGIASDVATLIRTAVVFLLLIGLFLASGESLSPSAISARSWLFLVLSGLATGASWLCYFRALKLGPASQVAPVDKLSVVLVALFGAAFLGERMSAVNWLGVALITGGVLLIAIK